MDSLNYVSPCMPVCRLLTESYRKHQVDLMSSSSEGRLQSKFSSTDSRVSQNSDLRGNIVFQRNLQFRLDMGYMPAFPEPRVGGGG